MDIVEFTKKIHELEIDHDFFNIKDENGLIYWDIVRHDVFYAIYYEITNIEPFVQKKIAASERVVSVLKNILHSIKLNLKIRKYNNICFIASRYKDKQQKNIDYAAINIVERIKNDDTLILETNIKFGQNYHFESTFNVGVFTSYYLSKLFKKQNYASTFEIAKILNDNFNLNINLDQIINSLLNRYSVEYIYYTNLFKKIKPQKIFVVQNGIQKGLFKAANDLSLPLLEIQHGLVSFIHPAYDYPKALDLKYLNSFPNYFLTFSNFWSHNINYPVEKIIAIGNDFFAQQVAVNDKKFELAIISANIYSKAINELLKSLLENGYKGAIALKLHPNQYAEKEIIKDDFAMYANVKVIYNELTIKELLQISNAILAVQSTCVYEALDMKVKVLLYKVLDYKTHEDVFSNANVYQISDFNEIKEQLKRNYIVEKGVRFFEPFKESVFLELFK